MPELLDLWAVRLPSELEEEWLCPAEHQRADRYRPLEKRRRFLTGRKIGRLISARYLDCTPQSVQWPISGPPRLSGPDGSRNYSFSYSHSADWLLLAVGPADVALGVDIEASPPQTPDTLAKVTLTRSELEEYSRIAIPDRPRWLQTAWVVKEATLKATASEPLPAPQEIEIGPLPTTDSAPRRAVWLGDDRPAVNLWPFDLKRGIDAGLVKADSWLAPQAGSPRGALALVAPCFIVKEGLIGPPPADSAGQSPDLATGDSEIVTAAIALHREFEQRGVPAWARRFEITRRKSTDCA